MCSDENEDADWMFTCGFKKTRFCVWNTTWLFFFLVVVHNPLFFFLLCYPSRRAYKTHARQSALDLSTNHGNMLTEDCQHVAMHVRCSAPLAHKGQQWTIDSGLFYKKPSELWMKLNSITEFLPFHRQSKPPNKVRRQQSPERSILLNGLHVTYLRTLVLAWQNDMDE